MITVTDAMKAHLAGPSQTLCTIVRVELRGGTVLGFTDHDVDIPYDGLLYVSISSYTRSDVASGSDLSVDNLELTGMLRGPSITEDDLRAGLWDFAAIRISMINYMDTSMEEIRQRTGRLGEVTLNRNSFKAEVRGLAQAYTRVMGRLTTPSCDAVLGDARCKIDLNGGSPNFTVTGALTGVGSDNRTMMDSARDEPGPTDGIAITGVTNADPGVVTLAGDLGLPSGSPIQIVGVEGMEDVNVATVALNVDGATFDLSQDTTDFGVYTGGGKVVPLGGGSGYFDNGVMTLLDCADSRLNGMQMEVQSYVPGQWILVLPFPYPVAIGDTYTMHAGCDYSMATCRDRFNNIINFRGWPFVSGTDKLMQIGKQS